MELGVIYQNSITSLNIIILNIWLSDSLYCKLYNIYISTLSSSLLQLSSYFLFNNSHQQHHDHLELWHKPIPIRTPPFWMLQNPQPLKRHQTCLPVGVANVNFLQQVHTWCHVSTLYNQLIHHVNNYLGSFLNTNVFLY